MQQGMILTCPSGASNNSWRHLGFSQMASSNDFYVTGGQKGENHQASEV